MATMLPTGISNIGIIHYITGPDAYPAGLHCVNSGSSAKSARSTFMAAQKFSNKLKNREQETSRMEEQMNVVPNPYVNLGDMTEYVQEGLMHNVRNPNSSE